MRLRLHAVLVAIQMFLGGLHGAQAESPLEPPPGLVTWWPLDETKGVLAADVVGGATGAHTGAPTPESGRVNGALHFHGSDYVTVADSDRWSLGTRDFTISLWANFDTGGSGSLGEPGDILIGCDEGPGVRNKWFFALGGGALNFHINGAASDAHFVPQVPFLPTPQVWYHLAVNRRGSLFSIFVNGEAKGSQSAAVTIPDPAAPLTIGQAENIGFMDGALDEVMFFDRALTDDEIRAIHDAGGAGLHRGLRLSRSRGGNNGVVTLTASGPHLNHLPTLNLAKPGMPPIPGTNVVVAATSDSLVCSLDLRGAATGPRDVLVMDGDSTAGLLLDGFTIEEGGNADVSLEVVGLGLIRVSREQSYWIFLEDIGNVDREVDRGHYVLSALVWDDPSATGGAPGSLPLATQSEDFPSIPLGQPRTLLFPVTIPAEGAYSINASLVADPDPGQFSCGELESLQQRFDSQLVQLDSLRATTLLSYQTEGDPGIRARLLETLRAFQTDIWNTSRKAGTVTAELVKRCGARSHADASGETRMLLRDAISDWDKERLGFAIYGVHTIASYDPNAKVGSNGFGPERFVVSADELRYVIHFENREDASAPAQVVEVSDDLDSQTLALSTVRLGQVGFGQHVLNCSDATPASFLGEVDLRPDTNLIVRVEGSLNPNTGRLTWRFSSLDPDTGDPPADPLAGFLPPNDMPPQGEGWVSFSVLPLPGLPGGTPIRNAARIVFDTNDAINTPEWTNTIGSSTGFVFR